MLDVVSYGNCGVTVAGRSTENLGLFGNRSEHVAQAHTDSDRLYYILTRATTPAEALTLADEAQAVIHVAVIPGVSDSDP